MYTENILRNRLNSLIENGLLSYDVLAKATDIEKCRIENYLSGKCNALSENDIENIKYELRLTSIADLLIEGMQVSEDDRVIGIIDVLIQIYGMTETVQCRNMRNRIFRKKEYSLLEQVPISVADSNALAVRNYEGTE